MKQSKRDRKIAEIDLFLKQVARPARKGHDPNDRHYDHKLERKLRKMDPRDLDALLNDEAEK